MNVSCKNIMEKNEIAQRMVRGCRKMLPIWEEVDLAGMSIEISPRGFSEVGSYGNPGPEEVSLSQEAYNTLEMENLSWSVTFGKEPAQGLLFMHKIITRQGLIGGTILILYKKETGFLFETYLSSLAKDLSAHKELEWRRQGLEKADIAALRELEHLKDRETTPLTKVKRAMLMSEGFEVRKRTRSNVQTLYGVWPCSDVFLAGV